MRVGLLAGLLTGAATGLIAALASVPLRRLAGVGDRSLINGSYIVAGALVLWLLLGALYVAVDAAAARRAVLGALAVVIALALVLIYTVLRNFATRCPSLAVPVMLIMTLGGAALFLAIVGEPFGVPLQFAAPGGFVAAVVVAGLVTAFDRQPGVHYTMSRLPATRSGSAGSAASTGSGASSGAAASQTGGSAATSGTSSGTGSSAASPTAGSAAAPTGGSAAAPAAPAGPLHFIVSSGTEAAFTVHEKLTRLPAPSDAIGKTQSISGDIYLVQGKGLADSPPSTITLDLSTLTSDSPQRDNFIKRNTLQVTQYPNATFTATSIDGFPASYKEGDEVKVTIHGTLQVHGTSQPVDWTGTARYANGQLEAILSTDVTMTQFGMQPPQVPVVQSVDDKVHLDMHLFASQQG